MLRIVNYLILILSVVLTALVLLQSKGGGLGSAFGGEGNAYHTRRGVERGIFITTIVLAVIFTGLILLAVFLQS